MKLLTNFDKGRYRSIMDPLRSNVCRYATKRIPIYDGTILNVLLILIILLNVKLLVEIHILSLQKQRC